MRTNKNSKKRKGIKIFAVIIAVLVCLVIFLQSGMIYTHNNLAWTPDYKKEDISFVLSEANFAKEQYSLIFAQTGLTKAAVDELITLKKAERILDIQEDFFADYSFKEEIFAPFTCSDRLKKSINLANLQKGDIIISYSSHISYLKSGHAALVVDTESGRVLNATGYGFSSSVDSLSEVDCRPTLLVLRPKADRETVNKVVDYALNNLVGKKYSLLAGITGGKAEDEKIKTTHCSHLVWYAFRRFGIELDSNGGPTVWPRDIAYSNNLELLQIYGIDLKEFE